MTGEVYNGPERRKASSDYRGPERRKPGRPRLEADESTAVLRVRVPSTLHDLACKLALSSGLSVSAVIRIALRAHVRRTPPTTP